MEYEWDEAKRESNLRKHGLDFRDVARSGLRGAIHFEPQYIDGEARERMLGFLGLHLVLVVYTLRGDRCRLISMRKATRHEYRLYERQ